jgi:LacI family transcriptional regulator
MVERAAKMPPIEESRMSDSQPMDGPGRSFKIVDIARQAGVSTATVDRVLNHRGGVRKPKRDLVLEVARRLNYPLPPHLVPVPGLKHLEFDFLLPMGPNTFMNILSDTAESVEERFEGYVATGRRHQIEGFNPVVLAESLLRIGAQSKGIAFIALEHPLVREAVNTLIERKVPVVTMVSDLSNSRRLGYVGVDNRAAGRTAGHLLGRFIGQREGQVAMIAGSLSYRGHEERELGFRQVLGEDFADLRIVALREGHDDPARNHAATRDLLQQYPDLLGFYNIGAGSRGVVQALEEAGKAKDVVFVGHELTHFTRRFLISGAMDAVINQNARHEVSACLRMLANCHAGVDPATNIEPTRIEVFLRENLP